eukprot:283991-Amorphochlora_amoeboformis.AAC.1
MADAGATTSTEGSVGPTLSKRIIKTLKMRFQNYLDRSTPFVAGRWLFLVVELILYSIRVYFIKGFHIIT